MTDSAPDLDAVQRQVGVLLTQGDPAAARTLLEQSLPLAEAERKPGRIASFLVLLATCHGQLMRFDAAESAFEEALRSADETLEPGHPVRVVAVASWAVFERNRGALDHEKRLWQLVLHVLQSDSRFADLLRNCVRSLEELETNAPKERQRRESFERFRDADLGPHTSASERGEAFDAVNGPAGDLGTLLTNMRRHREWSTLLRDRYIMRPEELWRRLTAVGASHRQPILDEQRCRFNLFLNGLLQNPRIEGVQTALETLAWRRGIGLEIHRCANRLARRDPEVRQTLDAIRFARARYAEEMFAAPPDAELRPRDGLKITLEPIEQKFDYQELEAKLLRRLEPQVNRFVSRPADCAELASRIPAEGVLIEYCRCTWPDGQGGVAASYVALVLPANRPDRASIVYLCEAAELEPLIFEYLSLLCGRSKTADFRWEDPGAIQSAAAREVGDKLRTLVLDSLLPWTQPDNIKHLLLVTDGLLNRLPFSALPLIDGYVMDRWLISYLHTARDLFASDEATGAPGQPLVVCEPAYDWSGPVEKEGFRFRPLEWAAREGEAVGQRLGVKPMTSTDATKTAVTTACRSPEILHIATHGMLMPARPWVAELGPVNPLVWRDEGELRLELPGSAVLPKDFLRLSGRQVPDQALRSIVALAGINTWLDGDPLPDEAANGLVNAEDIAALDLADNKLTVLSACETGLGVVGIGEGVLGLRSSFPIAGTETLVASLWSVDDVATEELMCEFYDNLLKRHMGRAEALQAAQQTIRKTYPDDPYYWAAFVCQGVIGPLRLAR